MEKIGSIILTLLIVSLLTACSINADIKNPPNIDDPIVDIPDDKDNTDPDQIYQSLSYNPEDYIGDLETFVYGLLVNQLEYLYDVFPGYVQLSDSSFVYGLVFTDYAIVYTNEDETISYFMTGFLPFVGELSVPIEDFDSGLIVHSLDIVSEDTVFIWTYQSDAFLEHCVVFGTYLQYGVNEEGIITFNANPFKREDVDTTLGSLYSYDQSRYLYDVDFGNYIPIKGISISETFDFVVFENEVNQFIEEQNAHWFSYDIESTAYMAKDAITAYLLSLQEESFLGYSVVELIEAMDALDPLEVFRVTPDGLSVVDIEAYPPQGATALTKWLVGTSCVILTGVGIVGQIVTIAVPPLSSLSGALAGFAIETFMQVVIESQSIENINWVKVGIATTAGSLSGFLGPFIQTLGHTSYFVVDSLIDGLIGATEQAVFAMMDKKSGQEIIEKFGYGFLLGAGLSAGFKVAGTVVSKAAVKLSEGASKIAEKLPQKLTATVTNFKKPLSNTTNAIGETILELRKKADSTVFHSSYISEKMMQKTIANLTEGQQEALLGKSINQLDANRVLKDNGAYFTPQSLKKAFKEAKDGDILGSVLQGGKKIPVVKKNGAIGITGVGIFDSVKLENKTFSFYTSKSIRNENLNEAALLLKKQWVQNIDIIPESVKNAIKVRYPNDDIAVALSQMTSSNSVRKIISEAGFTLHEELEIGIVTMMPTEIHSKIGHIGGVALEKWVKHNMGKIHFETFVSAATGGYVIGVNNG